MSSQFPTTVESFIAYLNGNEIAEYGKDGTTVMIHLMDIVTEYLQSELTERRRSNLYWQHSDPFEAVHLQSLLRRILEDLKMALREINIRSSVIKACEVWYLQFDKDHILSEHTKEFVQFESELHNIVNDIEVLRTLLRNSQGELSKCNPNFNKVADDIKKHFYGHLESLNEREKRLLNPGGYGRMNMQDSIRSQLDYSTWQTAWKQPFHGTALKSLETKLARNVEALIKSEPGKAEMSRIIPIVQSSGTGKSRLAEE